MDNLVESEGFEEDFNTLDSDRGTSKKSSRRRTAKNPVDSYRRKISKLKNQYNKEMSQLNSEERRLRKRIDTIIKRKAELRKLKI